MKKNPQIYFILIFIIFSVSVKATRYRWFESDYQAAVETKNKWFQYQENLKEQYHQKIGLSPISQFISERYDKSITFKELKLKDGRVLKLQLNSEAKGNSLFLDDVLLLSSFDLLSFEGFSDFSVDPFEDYAIVPVYSKGSTDKVNLYVIDLESERTVQKLENANGYSFFWKSSKEFIYDIQTGLQAISLSYDPLEDSIKLAQKTLSKIGDGVFLFKTTIEGDRFKLWIRVFNKEKEHTLYFDDFVVGQKDLGNALLFKAFSNETLRFYYLPYSFDFQGNVNFAAPIVHSLQSKGTVQNVLDSEGRFIFDTLYGEERHLHLFDNGANYLGVLPAPNVGSLRKFEFVEDYKFKLTFRSPVNKAYEVELNLRERESSYDVVRINNALSKDSDNNIYATQYVYAPSTNSVNVPVRVIYRADIPLSTDRPLLVEAYGGHGLVANFKPDYNGDLYPFLKAGGIHASPGVRGGGEYGSAWHEGGRHFNKLKTYEDVEASVRFLHANNLGSPETTGLMGWSSGGMMAGAVLTRSPELFKLVIPGNGLQDLLRKEVMDANFDRGWSSEYGGHTTEQEVNFLKSYSPLIQAQQKRSYPTVYVMAGAGDSRVNPIHSYKFTAALQDHQSGSNPIILNRKENGGHFLTSVFYDGLSALEATVELWSTIFYELGVSKELLKKSLDESLSESSSIDGEIMREQFEQWRQRVRPNEFPERKDRN